MARSAVFPAAGFLLLIAAALALVSAMGGMAQLAQALEAAGGGAAALVSGPSSQAAVQAAESALGAESAQKAAQAALDLAALAKTLPPVIPLPEVRTGISHALENHAEAEVNYVRQCFQDRGGAFFIVREEMTDRFGKPHTRFHLLCLGLDEANWVDRIVEKINGQWQEITAFIPKDGTIVEIEKWLARKVVQLWNSPLP